MQFLLVILCKRAGWFEIMVRHETNLLILFILLFHAEVYGSNDYTSWSRCSDINLLSWICFEGILHQYTLFRFYFLVVYSCCGILFQLTFPYGWTWKTSLLLGGLLSATDPVAVVALLKELGASKKLSTIIEGESLMNDGYRFSVI